MFDKRDIKIPNKVYIATPQDATSGGGHSLHQYAHILQSHFYDVYIVYINRTNKIVEQEIHENFKKYGLKTSGYIEDTNDNVVVCPEVSINFLDKFKSIKKMVWFLSWDYFYSSSFYFIDQLISQRGIPRILYSPAKVYYILRGIQFNWFYLGRKKKDWIFLYNCSYASVLTR